jgi:hypothetical protein
MTPFPPTFRRLLRRNIPQVHDEDLNRHENLFALRHQLVIDRHSVAGKYVHGSTTSVTGTATTGTAASAPAPKVIDEDIMDATAQAQVIFSPYAKVYDASLRLWVARRQIVLQQGNFFQIPLSLKKIGKLLKAIVNYRKTQLQTLPAITVNRIKNVSLIRVISFIVFLALLMGSMYALMPKKPQPDQVQQEQIR